MAFFENLKAQVEGDGGNWRTFVEDNQTELLMLLTDVDPNIIRPEMVFDDLTITESTVATDINNDLDPTQGGLGAGTSINSMSFDEAGGVNELVINTPNTEFRQNIPYLTLESLQSVVEGTLLGLEQKILVDAGQTALTILAVGNTTTGKVQGVSLGAGNVIEVYSSGTDFNNGTVLYREFMSEGEPICFTGLSNGAIITSTKGFYGMSEQTSSPMPLLSYGLSFTSTFLYGFRNSDQGNGFIKIVNGPLENTIKLTDGAGTVQLSQENIVLQPWEFRSLDMNGNQEYILEGTNPMMACMYAANNSFYDSRLVMPLTDRGITWPRSGFVSSPYNNTSVDYFVRDNAEGSFTVSPNSPVDFDGVTGATDADYEPNGATQVFATGLISAFSGADSAGLEASPLMPVSAMTQVVAQPFHIDDSGDGGSSGIAIASPYEGEAKVYEWNDVTSQLDLAYTVPITRNGVTINSKEDQKHPAAGGVANEASMVTLAGNLNPGLIVADVPITVVCQSATQNGITLRSQNSTTTTAIFSDDDETLMLGWTPDEIKAEITEGSDGIIYKRSISGGAEIWEVA